MNKYIFLTIFLVVVFFKANTSFAFIPTCSGHLKTNATMCNSNASFPYSGSYVQVGINGTSCGAMPESYCQYYCAYSSNNGVTCDPDPSKDLQHFVHDTVAQTAISGYQASGYTCTTVQGALDPTYNFNPSLTAFNFVYYQTTTCTKATTVYSATINNPYSITANSNVSTLTQTKNYSDGYYVYIGNTNSPFVYFYNPPEGLVSFSVTSPSNEYFPKPKFNKTNGWNLTGNKEKKSISLEGKEQKNLFYELNTKDITLSRNGKNFSSKIELITYLKNSNFFDTMGFSQEEKKNSLNYVEEKIRKENKKYYYLTILEKDAVKDISNVTVDPKPNNIIRNYFVVYPTDIPVTTRGDILFPKQEKIVGDDFAVKETGEIVIGPNMFISFK